MTILTPLKPQSGGHTNYCINWRDSDSFLAQDPRSGGFFHTFLGKKGGVQKVSKFCPKSGIFVIFYDFLRFFISLKKFHNFLCSIEFCIFLICFRRKKMNGKFPRHFLCNRLHFSQNERQITDKIFYLRFSRTHLYHLRSSLRSQYNGRALLRLLRLQLHRLQRPLSCPSQKTVLLLVSLIHRKEKSFYKQKKLFIFFFLT